MRLGEAREESTRLETRHHVPGSPAEEKRARAIALLSTRSAQKPSRRNHRRRLAVADEQEIAAHEHADQAGVDHSLDRRAERGLPGDKVEHGGDGAGDEDDRRELPTADSRARRAHSGLRIAPACRGAPAVGRLDPGPARGLHSPHAGKGVMQILQEVAG
jgi:hypothetical protein